MCDAKPQFRSLELAAYGWNPADWERMFYPEDLPEDWRISYYANEFGCVLLPAEDWKSPLMEAAFWQAEVSPDFRFYLEITLPLLQAEHWPQVCGAVEKYLAPQVKGLLLTKEVVEHLPENWRNDFLLHVQQSNECLTLMPVGAESQTGLLREQQPLSPQALRTIFECLQAQTEHSDVTLFLDVPWGTVEQFRLMQQLYGV